MRGEEKKANIERRNFPDGKPRRKVKQMDPITAHTASPDETFVGAVVETLLKQYGRDFFQDPCVAEVCDDYTIGIEYPLTKPPWLAATCCAAKMTQLSSPNLVNDKRRETIEETAEAFNPSHIDLLYTSVPPLTEYAQAYSGTALVQLGLTALPNNAPPRVVRLSNGTATTSTSWGGGRAPYALSRAAARAAVVPIWP